VSTSCRRKNYCRGNARSKSMASLVCVRPAFNNIAGRVARESLSASLNPRVESSLSQWTTLSIVSHTSLRWVSLVAGSRGALADETVTNYRPAAAYDLATGQRPASCRRALPRGGTRAPEAGPPVSFPRRAKGATAARGQLRPSSRSFRVSSAVTASRQNSLAAPSTAAGLGSLTHSRLPRTSGQKIPNSC
jgi:hypothetical protein